MKAYDIIKRPVITEKTTIQRETINQVCFEVSPDANRIEIKRAIEEIFNVRASQVRTMNVKGKLKRKGKIVGKRKDWKKAMATLAPGERIGFFEGA